MLFRSIMCVEATPCAERGLLLQRDAPLIPESSEAQRKWWSSFYMILSTYQPVTSLLELFQLHDHSSSKRASSNSQALKIIGLHCSWNIGLNLVYCASKPKSRDSRVYSRQHHKMYFDSCSKALGSHNNFKQTQGRTANGSLDLYPGQSRGITLDRTEEVSQWVMMEPLTLEANAHAFLAVMTTCILLQDMKVSGYMLTGYKRISMLEQLWARTDHFWGFRSHQQCLNLACLY